MHDTECEVVRTDDEGACMGSDMMSAAHSQYAAADSDAAVHKDNQFFVLSLEAPLVQGSSFHAPPFDDDDCVRPPIKSTNNLETFS